MNRRISGTREGNPETGIPGFRVLGEAETKPLLGMADAVEACRLVFADLGAGRGVLSDPPAMFMEAGGGGPTHFKVKGGHVPTFNICGFRIAGDVGEGGEEHYCYLVDPDSAQPRGLIAQTHLHRMRTAATGLLAVKLLTSHADPVVALIGSGRIATCLAEGFGEVFPGGRLRIASRDPENARALARKTGNSAVKASATVSDAVAEADAVIALTSAREPIVASTALRTGATIVGMGEHHELPHELLFSADSFFVDDFAFATVLGSLSAWLDKGLVTREAAAARITGTLGEIAAGKLEGRGDPHHRILAIVQGVAIADIALAEICRRRGAGEQWLAEDVAGRGERAPVSCADG